MGVAKLIAKIFRNPRFTLMALGVAVAHLRKNYEVELKCIRRVKAYAVARGKSDAVPKSWHAREAVLCVYTGEFDVARQMFLELLKTEKTAEGREARNVYLLAQYWISVINVNAAQADYWARKADEEDVHTFGLNEIPPPMNNELREGWDEEVKDLLARAFERELS